MMVQLMRYRCMLSTQRPLLCMQVNQLLELQDMAAGTQKYEAIHKWTTHVNALHNTIVSRLQ